MKIGIGPYPRQEFALTCWWCGYEFAYFVDGPYCPKCSHDVREAFEEILGTNPIPKEDPESGMASPEDEIARLEELLRDADQDLDCARRDLTQAKRETKKAVAKETKKLGDQVDEMNLALLWACVLLDQQQVIPPKSEKGTDDWDEMTEKQRLHQWRKDLIRMGKLETKGRDVEIP